MKILIIAMTLLLSPAVLAAEGQNRTSKTGVYWVPVGQQLSQYALFTLPHVEIKVLAEKIKVEYELPLELTGTPNKVEFEGPRPLSGPMVLEGDYGTMECPRSEDFSSCAVTYRQLKFNAEVRSALLQSLSQNPEELRKRQAVAARFQFGGEPHGFLRVLNY